MAVRERERGRLLQFKKEIFHFFLANEFCDLLFIDKYFLFFIFSCVSHLEIFVLAIFDAAVEEDALYEELIL